MLSGLIHGHCWLLRCAQPLTICLRRRLQLSLSSRQYDWSAKTAERNSLSAAAVVLAVPWRALGLPSLRPRHLPLYREMFLNECKPLFVFTSVRDMRAGNAVFLIQYCKEKRVGAKCSMKFVEGINLIRCSGSPKIVLSLIVLLLSSIS